MTSFRSFSPTAVRASASVARCCSSRAERSEERSRTTTYRTANRTTVFQSRIGLVSANRPVTTSAHDHTRAHANATQTPARRPAHQVESSTGMR